MKKLNNLFMLILLALFPEITYAQQVELITPVKPARSVKQVKQVRQTANSTNKSSQEVNKNTAATTKQAPTNNKQNKPVANKKATSKIAVNNKQKQIQNNKNLNKPAEEQTYPFVLPKLPYSYAALEPFIDARTMKIHHDMHHKTYVEKLNKALEESPKLHNLTLLELVQNPNKIPAKIRVQVIDNAGGHLNHSFFWLIMQPQEERVMRPGLKKILEHQFGSIEKFKSKFTEAAKNVFGSGWAWLVIDKDGKLSIQTSADQDSLITKGFIPLLGLDVWEHAYYLKYQNKRANYIDAWWNVVNWDQVSNNLRKAKIKLNLKKQNS